MQTIFRSLINYIRKSPGGTDEAAERFLAKSENFRLLLAANNEALEHMAEMTEDSRSGTVFGMAHVRALSLKTAASVRRMIEHLCRMRPDRYDALKDVFNRIVLSMEQAVVHRPDQTTGPLVLGLEHVRAESMPETGSKVALLGEVGSRLDVRIPQGFAITASAFRMFMESTGLEDEINRLIQITDSNELDELRTLERNIRHAIDMAAIPPELESAIDAQCKTLLAGNDSVRLAVRSSALGEDGEDASFAGQFLSLLGVAPGDVAEAYRSVVASMFSATAMLYRFNRGIREDGVVMCVGCMEMIDALAGGVVYTRNPVIQDSSELIVSGVPGLPGAVVDGSARSDTWRVDRRDLEIRGADIAKGKLFHELGPDGELTGRELRNSLASAPCLTEEQVVLLAGMSLRMEEHFGGPQDVEWALDCGGQLYILQCRPLALAGNRTSGGSGPENEDDAVPAILEGAAPASPGAASGHVFLVESDEDMLEFPDGAVLVTRNARPQLSALLPKASALVAEFGSTASHLANVAREFAVPALIGAPGAVDRLSGVSVVTVNADRGAVYLGVCQDQIDAVTHGRHALEENEVLRALQRVLPYVVPLNLTDPDAPEFVPDGCRSLHDITRFCHEMGVAEMFSGGDLPTANARKLKGELPMLYWLVDVGGGTVEGDTGFITLDDVLSNAMLALWHGMTAVEWEGPPPVSAGGFMSVVSEAAQNPALAPGMANEMGRRNYFIVGRHYCNLQSRFGFHFCTVEGFAGDDPGANHALFQYRGGGADMGRRRVRIRLVAGLLEEHGFIVEARDDSLYARIEGVAREAVERALAVVGYLLVHTRQIDMVMAEVGAESRYRERFAQDIDTVLAGLPQDLNTRERGQ